MEVKGWNSVVEVKVDLYSSVATEAVSSPIHFLEWKIQNWTQEVPLEHLSPEISLEFSRGGIFGELFEIDDEINSIPSLTRKLNTFFLHLCKGRRLPWCATLYYYDGRTSGLFNGNFRYNEGMSSELLVSWRFFSFSTPPRFLIYQVLAPSRSLNIISWIWIVLAA